MKVIIAKNIKKTFYSSKKTLETLEKIDMEIEKNEFISVVGPSGCGKSTLLNIFAGLESFEGDLVVNAKTALMPQTDSMMPWRSVYQNIILPLEINQQKTDSKMVDQLIEEFGLKGFEESRPYQLSGGMRKRAALLRTYLVGGDIMLLDEPFAALDYITRLKMTTWLVDIWQRHKKTMVFVTHDIEEAIFLSDRIYVLSQRPGVVLECIPIDLPRPRKRSDEQFQKIFEKIFSLL